MRVETRIPSEYRAGYEKARALDPALAATYVEYTVVGDPAADAAVDALSALDDRSTQRFIRAGMDQDTQVFARAPQPLRAFFDALETPPAWLDLAAFEAGQRAFHRQSDLFVLALLVDVIIRGFTTLIGKAFFTTGRMTDRTVRRLRQNVLQFVETMMPHSLERHGDAWKLSVRIRIIHARARRLLSESDEWDEADFGVPISAATIAMAAAGFSAQLLEAATRLGARLNERERESFIQIWRYAGWLLGVPDALAFRAEADARALYRVASLCEPPIEDEAIAMANSAIRTAPIVAGVTDPERRRALSGYGYRLSRALVGAEMADALRFPKQYTFGVLPLLRLKAALVHGLGIRLGGESRLGKFERLLEMSNLGDRGISYRLPEHMAADRGREW